MMIKLSYDNFNKNPLETREEGRFQRGTFGDLAIKSDVKPVDSTSVDRNIYVDQFAIQL